MNRIVAALATFTAGLALTACSGSAALQEITAVTNDSPSAQADATEGEEAIVDSVDETPLPLIVDEFTYAVSDGGHVHWAATLRNPNNTLLAQFPRMRLTALAGDGSILTTEEAVSGVIPPRSTSLYAGQLSTEEIPAEVTIEMLGSDWVPGLAKSSEYPAFGSANITIFEDSKNLYSVTGMVTNPFDVAMDSMGVWVHLRNESGALVGGDVTFINDVAAGGSAPFEVSFINTTGRAATAEIHAVPWGQVDPWMDLAEGRTSASIVKTQEAPPTAAPSIAPESSGEVTASGPAGDLTANQIADQMKERMNYVTKVVYITEENDTNDLLGRPTGYTSSAVLHDKRFAPAAPDETSVSNGATIEVFATEELAQARQDYIDEIAKDSTLLGQYTHRRGPALIRADFALKPSEWNRYVEVFTAVTGG